MGGDSPSPQTDTGAAHADKELTKNATAAPESVTPMDLGDGNFTSNLTPPTGLEDQVFPANINNGIRSAGSSGANDDN